MHLKIEIFVSFMISIMIHNTMGASFEHERIYHRNPFQQVRARVVAKTSTSTVATPTTATNSRLEIEVDAMQCPVACVCQYARFNDLPLSRWINYMQSTRSPTTTTTRDDNKNVVFMSSANDNNNAAEQEDDEQVTSDEDAGDLTTTNPYIKQATCILQPEHDMPTLINLLPHDLQALILLYTGIGQNETINISLLKPLNQLNTLEIRGSQERTLRLVFDEPLPFLLHANFEFVTLMGTKNGVRPKSSPHPSDVFNYKPKGEIQAEIYDWTDMQLTAGQLNIRNLKLQQLEEEEEEHVEILPYELYVQEKKKERMPHFFGWQQLLVLRVHDCQLQELHWEMFDGLESLQHLSLERNSIAVVPPFALYGVRNIRTLSLAHNAIHDLHYRDLAGLLQLETLDLSHNRLHKLSEMTFPPFPKLQYVDFRENGIKYILPAAFWVMNTTRSMYFESHDIALELWNNAPFDTLRDLKSLQIANVSVEVLQQNMFKGLSTLEKLYLRGKIHSIEFDAFASLTSLRELILSECQINEISMDAFIGCKRLELLDLSHNNLTYLPVGIFDEQPLLAQIYLQHNQLRTLPTAFFLQPQLHLARLHDNPWKCSCDMSNWLPRITNQLSGQRSEICVRDFQTEHIVSCKSSTSSKLDRRLAPRCNNYNGRSVFYVLRKQLQCHLNKRSDKTPQRIPHWRKMQLFNVTSSTGNGHIASSQRMRKARLEKNTLEYALLDTQMQGLHYNNNNNNNNNNNSRSNRNSYAHEKEISNEI